MNGILILAAGNWLSVLVPIIFVIIYVLNQMLTANKANPQQRPKPTQRRPGGDIIPRPQQRPQQQPPQGGKPGAGNQSQLNAEIEQFLKRANERRGDRARREVAPAQQSSQKSPSRVSETAAPVDVRPLEGAEQRDFGRVAASVEKHMGDRGFSQRAEHLADDIVRADQQMEKHLQQAFSRRVGTLNESSAAPTGPVTDAQPQPIVDPSSAAAMISGLIGNPQSLKTAIVLNEILSRPEHRW